MNAILCIAAQECRWSPGLMCPIWESRGPFDNRGNHCTRIGGIPQIVMGRVHAAVARCRCESELGVDKTPADGVADQARRLVDIELRHDPGP